MLLLWILLYHLYVICINSEDPVVSTKYGDVEGEAIVISDGKVINSFLGIPYAKPPIGDLRFTNPQEPEPWDETFPATDLGDACMQPLISTVQLTHFGWTRFSEDCLHLNIYTPEREDPDDLIPVMVWIHGGRFQGGANFMYPGYFLAENDVVVVSINYRLGILGFAYSEDGAVPGNMGLADQILALRFVQENIAAFGGDPGRVTIFGESAGAASVGILLMSPLAAGLFHGAILQSGNEFAPWAFLRSGHDSEDYLTQVAVGFGCPIGNTEDMVECLKEVDPRRLINAEFNCTVGHSCSGFRPVIDGHLLPDHPSSIRKRGEYNKVPEMIGITGDESAIFLAGEYPTLIFNGLNRSEFDEIIWEKLSVYTPAWNDPSRDVDVFEAIRFYYADWPYFDDPERNRDMFVRLDTDASFGFTADWQAKLHAGDGLPVYFYIHDYIPETFFFPEWLGSFHFVDIIFTFGWPMMQLEVNEMALNHSQANAGVLTLSDQDQAVSELIITLWTNFAKSSNPTPVTAERPLGTSVIWPQFVKDDLNFLLLKYPLEAKRDYRQQDYAFWREYLSYVIYGDDFKDSSFTIPFNNDLMLVADNDDLSRDDIY